MKIKKFISDVSVFEVLISLSLVIVMAGLLRSSCKNVTQSSIDKPRSDSLSELVVKEHGYLFYNGYVVFEDKTTKTRIFYYRNAMVVLPPKKEN